jgi:hypothetical protein
VFWCSSHIRRTISLPSSTHISLLSLSTSIPFAPVFIRTDCLRCKHRREMRIERQPRRKLEDSKKHLREHRHGLDIQRVTSSLYTFDIPTRGQKLAARVRIDDGEGLAFANGHMKKNWLIGDSVRPFKPRQSFRNFTGPFKISAALAAGLKPPPSFPALALVRLRMLHWQ